MKFAALMLVCALSANFMSGANAFFGFGFPFGFGFGGLGFPLAGPGIFGRIFPPIIPHLRPGLPIRNGLGFFPFGGKRDVEAVGGEPQTEEANKIKSMCSVSTLTSALICNGLEKNTIFECVIEPRGNVTRFKLVLEDLIAERPVTREPVNSLTLLSRRAKGKFTYINPVNRTQEFISIFSNENSAQNGFLVKDPSCFQKFVQLVDELPSQQIKISLFSSP